MTAYKRCNVSGCILDAANGTNRCLPHAHPATEQKPEPHPPFPGSQAAEFAARARNAH